MSEKNKGNKKTMLFFVLFCISSALCFYTSAIFAQSSPVAVIQDVLKSPESGNNRLIALQFGATGMTESAARAFSKIIAQNLSNTNHFEVFSLEDVEEEIQRLEPSLLPCFEMGCGIQIGKRLESDWILSGHISLTSTGMFSLNIKMVFVFDNSLAFEDTIRFTDETMDRQFYKLANRIANNAPIIGNILEANNKIAVINLGEQNGISIGDQLIIFRNVTVSSEMNENFTENVRRKNIGILRITKVGKTVSEGVYFQTIEIPAARQFVSTFLDKRKQITQVDEIRKELDTHLRNVFEIKKPIELSPVHLEDMEKKKWAQRIRTVEANRDLWQTVLIGSLVGMVYLLSQSESLDDMQRLGALGVFGYSTYEYFSNKSKLKKLTDEGRYKGYLELNIRPELDEVGLKYILNF
ncbi:hypothetical protein KKA14_08435 [bacterium]|nr:hypothetical protein [bacterium]